MLQNDGNIVSLKNSETDDIFAGWAELSKKLFHIVRNQSKTLVIAFDGYLGADWENLNLFFTELKNLGVSFDVKDCSNLWKDSTEIWYLIRKSIECDVHFGRIYNGELEDFLNYSLIQELINYLTLLSKKQIPELVILYGNGIFNKFTKKFFDVVFYIDVLREDFLRKIEKYVHKFLPNIADIKKGQADVGLSLATFKLSQYVCTPIFDKHRRQLIRNMNYYILFESEAKIISKNVFEKTCNQLSLKPFKLRPLYIPGPWGGQWIKKIRNLDPTYPNCAWAFEAVTGDMCLQVNINNSFHFDLPFTTFLSYCRERIVGTRIFRRFGHFFPIRIHYDDSYDGGNMAIQVHPDQKYVKRFFNEKVGQHEAYYIVKRKSHAGVYLGLKEDVDVDEFAQEAKRSYENRIPFDYEKYVNFFESKEGDLFLIPAGTVHALGRDQVCVEIGTSYGYTFHIYDYLRPNLKGELREIHIEHAFAALKKTRRTKRVERSLIPKAKLVRSQGKSKEYLLGRKHGMIFEVRRLDLEPGIWHDETHEVFHMLILLKGDNVEISPTEHKNPVLVEWLRSVIIPANVGKYAIKSTQKSQILKVIPYSR